MDDVPPPYTRAYTTPVVASASTTSNDLPRVRRGFWRRNRVLPEPSESSESSNGSSLYHPQPYDLPEQKLIIVAQVITPDLSPEDFPYPQEIIACPDRDVSAEAWISFADLILQALFEDKEGSSSQMRSSISGGQFHQRQQVIRAVIDRWNEAFFEQRNIHIVPAFYYPKHLLLTPTGSVRGSIDADDISTIIPVSSRGSRDTSIDRSRGGRTPSTTCNSPWQRRSLDYSPTRSYETLSSQVPDNAPVISPYIERSLQRVLSDSASNVREYYHNRCVKGWGTNMGNGRRPWGRSGDIPLQDFNLSQSQLSTEGSTYTGQRSSSVGSTTPTSWSVDSCLSRDLEDPNMTELLRDSMASHNLDPTNGLDMMRAKFQAYNQLHDAFHVLTKGATRKERHAAKLLMMENKRFLDTELKRYKEEMIKIKQEEKERLNARKMQLNAQVTAAVSAALTPKKLDKS